MDTQQEQALTEFAKWLIATEPDRQKRQQRDQEWEQTYGRPYPHTLPLLQRYAAEAGIPADRLFLDKGVGIEWLETELLPIIEGHLSRQKPNGETPIDDDALLSATRLAELYGDNPDALRKRLERYRKNNLDGWVENTERGPNDPQFVYRYGAVKHLLK